MVQEKKHTRALKKRETKTSLAQTNSSMSTKAKNSEKRKIKNSKKFTTSNDKNHKAVTRKERSHDQNESLSDSDDYSSQNHEEDPQDGEYLDNTKNLDHSLEAQENDSSQSQKFKIIVEDSSDGEDSSDDDENRTDDFANNVPMILLDPKDEKNLKKRLEGLADKGLVTKRGIVYLGRIPHGFYEEEMRAYFSQFGTVTRLRLSRNKKTGKSKHYAFIEFASEEVACIVAETMDNYLLYESLLQCKVIPPEQVHENLWIGANKKFVPDNYIKIAAQLHNRKRTREEKFLQNQRLLKKDAKRRKKLEELGIDYEFPGYTVQKVIRGSHTVYDKVSENE